MTLREFHHFFRENKTHMARGEASTLPGVMRKAKASKLRGRVLKIVGHRTPGLGEDAALRGVKGSAEGVSEKCFSTSRKVDGGHNISKMAI
jgi:hypothetical protein